MVCLQIVLILMKDRFTVCAKRTIVLEFVVDADEGLPGDVGLVESCFGPFVS